MEPQTDVLTLKRIYEAERQADRIVREAEGEAAAILRDADEQAAGEGLSLLRSKREALVRELFGIMEQAVATRDLFTETLQAAMRALAVSLELEGRAGIASSTVAASREFEKALEVVLRVVSVETRLKKIGAEIGKATRRVNAFTEVVIPQLAHQIRTIRLSLEKREREDIFRMKHFKSRGA